MALKYNPLLEENFQELNPAGPGGGDLQATLLAGNTTGGRNILMSDGDRIATVNGNSMIDLRYQGVDDLWLISNEATQGVGTFTISNTLGTGEISFLRIQVGVTTSLQLTFGAVPFNTSIQQTALDLVSNINSNNPPNDYVAEIITDIGGVITIRITSPSSTGVSPGFGNFTSIVTGDMTVTSVSSMANTPTFGGYILGQPTNSGESLLLGYNPYDQIGIRCERNLVVVGALDSQSPATYVTLTTLGMGVFTEANWLPVNPIPPSTILIINAIAENRSMQAIQGMAVMINTGASGVGNESTYNSGVIRSVIVAGQGITAKTDDTLYTNQISLQPSGNTFDGMLAPSAITADRTWTFPNESGEVAIAKETFYLERVEEIDEGSTTPIEYFTEVQGGTEISNVVNAIGGTYSMDISIVCTNTSVGGYVVIEPKIGATSVFIEPFTKQAKGTSDIFYVNISKRVTLAAGNNTINLELSNSGGGDGRIYEANITLKKI